MASISGLRGKLPLTSFTNGRKTLVLSAIGACSFEIFIDLS